VVAAAPELCVGLYGHLLLLILLLPILLALAAIVEGVALPENLDVISLILTLFFL